MYSRLATSLIKNEDVEINCMAFTAISKVCIVQRLKCYPTHNRDIHILGCSKKNESCKSKLPSVVSDFTWYGLSDDIDLFTLKIDFEKSKFEVFGGSFCPN